MGWDVASGPGVTALGLAAARAVETARADRLVEDPYARALFEAGGSDLPMLLDWPDREQPVSDAQALHLHGSRYIGLRTRFYDDILLAAVRDGIGQVVLLGAGLDTRAFRLDVPHSLRVFELDQPGVLDFKNRVLGAQGAEARCARSAIGVDLRENWAAALLAGGFNPDLASVWIIEGLLAYLPPPDQAELLGRACELAAGDSVLAFDRITGDPAKGGRLRDLSERSGLDMGGLIAQGEADDLAAVLRDQGCRVDEEPTSALADRYGRDLSVPFGAGNEGPEPPWLDTMFLSARLA